MIKRTILFVGSLFGLVLLYVIFFRPDIFWSAEEKVVELTIRDLENSINDEFIRLQENETTIDVQDVLRTEQHTFQIVELHYDPQTLCILYSVETPTASKWGNWFPFQGEMGRAVQSRQVATIKISDDLGTNYSLLGLNSSTDAVKKAANIACYSNPVRGERTLHVALGDKRNIEKYAEFQIELN